jgi:hypothetical protein
LRPCPRPVLGYPVSVITHSITPYIIRLYTSVSKHNPVAFQENIPKAEYSTDYDTEAAIRVTYILFLYIIIYSWLTRYSTATNRLFPPYCLLAFFLVAIHPSCLQIKINWDMDVNANALCTVPKVVVTPSSYKSKQLQHSQLPPLVLIPIINEWPLRSGLATSTSPSHLCFTA